MLAVVVRTFLATFGVSYFLSVAALASEPVLVGNGIDAKWSPDEHRVSYVRGNALYVGFVGDNHAEICVYSGHIFTYEWLTDTSLAVMEKRYFDVVGGRTRLIRVSTSSVSGKSRVLFSDSTRLSEAEDFRPLQRYADGSIGFSAELSGVERSMRISEDARLISRGVDTLTADSWYVQSIPGAWGPVWLCTTDRGAIRQLTPGPEFYLLPSLSPTADKFVCNNSRGDLIVFDTLGNLICNLGFGDIAVWSRDGSQLTFCRTIETEADIAGSDIYVASVDCTVEQLTNTPDIIELDPQFSPRRDFILYREYPANGLYLLPLTKR